MNKLCNGKKRGITITKDGISSSFPSIRKALIETKLMSKESSLNKYEAIKRFERNGYIVSNVQKTKEQVSKPIIKVNKSQVKRKGEFCIETFKGDETDRKALAEKLLKKVKSPTIKKDGFYVPKDTWKRLIIDLLVLRKNVLLTGASGTGKTELVQRFANAIKSSIEVYDMSAFTDATAGLFGSHRMKSGTSYFDKAHFYNAIQKGGVILLDEITRATRETGNHLFSVLDDRKILTNPYSESDSDNVAKVDSSCMIIATANEGYQYTGTKTLDEALRQRFVKIHIDYLPSKIESDVLVKRCGISHDDATKLVKIAEKIRERCKDESLNRATSLRELIDAGDYLSCGESFLDAVEWSIVSGYQDDEQDEIRDLIKQFG